MFSMLLDGSAVVGAVVLVVFMVLVQCTVVWCGGIGSLSYPYMRWEVPAQRRPKAGPGPEIDLQCGVGVEVNSSSCIVNNSDARIRSSTSSRDDSAVVVYCSPTAAATVTVAMHVNFVPRCRN